MRAPSYLRNRARTRTEPRHVRAAGSRVTSDLIECPMDVRAMVRNEPMQATSSRGHHAASTRMKRCDSRATAPRHGAGHGGERAMRGSAPPPNAPTGARCGARASSATRAAGWAPARSLLALPPAGRAESPREAEWPGSPTFRTHVGGILIDHLMSSNWWSIDTRSETSQNFSPPNDSN